MGGPEEAFPGEVMCELSSARRGGSDQVKEQSLFLIEDLLLQRFGDSGSVEVKGSQRGMWFGMSLEWLVRARPLVVMVGILFFILRARGGHQSVIS